jgi:transcriptional regulator with XRE-family HTH domain
MDRVAVARLTGEQIRAARALARIEQTVLAESSGLSLETIKRVERIRGPVNVSAKTSDALTAAFLRVGVVFDERGGLHTTYGGTEDAGGLERLLYASTATAADGRAQDSALRDIIRVSARRNALLGVTGVLLAFRGRFLQVLEGPPESLSLLYAAIRSDRRHLDVQTLEHKPVDQRAFGSWTMRAATVSSDQEATLPDLGLWTSQPGEPAVRAATGLLRLVHEQDVRLTAAI